MKILYIADKYYPKAQATVICAQNVIDELIKEGYRVDIIAYEDSCEKILHSQTSSKVYYVKPDIRKRLEFFANDHPNNKYSKIFGYLSVMLNRIHKILLLPWYPLYNLSFPARILSLCERLHAQNHYDAVLSLYWPFESVLAGFWFKKKHPEIKWIAYVIDPISTYSFSFLSLGKSMKKWFRRFAEMSDLYIFMRPNSAEYKSSGFRKISHKLAAADIPAMIPQTHPRILNKNENNIENWVYTGALGAPHYLSADLLRIFLSLPEDKHRVLHLYSKGPEFQKIQENIDKYKGRINCHDYVSHDELETVLSNADVLVCMKYTSLISAKIFEYMSYGKPVLHISGIKNDPNASYLSHYERALVLPVYNTPAKQCVNIVSEWLHQIYNLDFTAPVDLSYFEPNTPEYTANLIIERMNGEKDEKKEKNR